MFSHCSCCYCTSKTRKSESKSQLGRKLSRIAQVVIALAKLENLKANHNYFLKVVKECRVVIALAKLENLKANHNPRRFFTALGAVVIALAKLENLKANHNGEVKFQH